MKGDRFRARSEPSDLQHLLRVVDRDFGRQHFVQNCSYGSHDNYEYEFLHEQRVAGRR